MQFSRYKTTNGRQRRGDQAPYSNFIYNEGVFIATTPPSNPPIVLPPVQSDSKIPAPCRDYAYLRQISKAVHRSPSEGSFQSALSRFDSNHSNRLDSLSTRTSQVPSTLQLYDTAPDAGYSDPKSFARTTDSDPKSVARTTDSDPKSAITGSPFPVVRSQENPTTKQPGLRVPLRTTTPGYIRETPRSLPLKRQLTKTPQIPSATDSLYLSWKEYFMTPDPYTNYLNSQLFDSIKMHVPDSIKDFLDEIEYNQSPTQSFTTAKELPSENQKIIPSPVCITTTPPAEGSPDTILVLNVSGECFMVRRALFARYPKSLLGSRDIENYFVESLNCYFFNRSRVLFEYILQLYQCGFINPPPGFLSLSQNKEALNRELEFFKLGSELKGRSPIAAKQPIRSRKAEADEIIRLIVNGPGWTKYKQLKLTLYLFLTNPQSSVVSMAWMIFDMLLVVLSITALIVDSEPRYRHILINQDSLLSRVFFTLEVVSQSFFTIDFALRLFSWPRARTFFKNGMNACDFVSLLPFYVPQIIQLLDSNLDGRNVKTLIVFRVIRMFRIARVFRIIRHSHGLLIIFQFLFNSGKELIMLAGLFGILTLLFSSCIYFLEPHEGPFSSIPAAGWWAVVSLTGVGYGDVVPKSTPGVFLAVAAIMTGVIFLALPMTIIITKFTKHMERHYQL